MQNRHLRLGVPPLALLALLTLSTSAPASPFATRVLSYDPAPGQFVQNSTFNIPAKALGPPGSDGGLSAASNLKVVTLGGFGGSIVLGFDAPIWANRFNPHHMDFIVYGNSFFVAGDPTRRFAELGVIEVSRDVNANGQADDPWFLIPGSSLPPTASQSTKLWSAAALNPLWIPPGRSGTWTTIAYTLPSSLLASPILVNTSGTTQESVFGYADLMPTLLLGDTNADNIIDEPALDPDLFYTVPDDPFTIGVSPGSGGGSAIRIAWAVNSATGAAANLPSIDFVRISTSADITFGPLGEYSVELSAVADVAPIYSPDWNQDSNVNVADIFAFLGDWFAGIGESGGADIDLSGATTVADIFTFLSRWFTGT